MVGGTWYAEVVGREMGTGAESDRWLGRNGGWLQASYTVNDKGFEEQSAVGGLVQRGVNHSRGMVE